jgi:hypothetical protein
VVTRDSCHDVPGRRAGERRRTRPWLLAALLAASAPGLTAAPLGCPDDVETILRSMRQLHSSAAKKSILDPLAHCLSVTDFVRELRAFRPSPAHSRAFLEVSERAGLSAEDAAAILAGSHTLTSLRTRQQVILNLIEVADQEELLRHARTLPGPLMQPILARLVEREIRVNDPPVPQDQSLHTPRDTPIEIRLTTNEAGYMEFEVTQPDHGAVFGVDDSPDTVLYRPDEGFTGTDSFEFMAHDGDLDSTENGTVTITVGRR